MPVSHQQRARERRRALAVSAAAFLFIAGSVATIVLVRAQGQHDDPSLTVASLVPAQTAAEPAQPAAKPAQAARVKPAKPIAAATAPVSGAAHSPKPAITVLNKSNPRWDQPAAAAKAQPANDGDGEQAYASAKPKADAASKAIQDEAEPAAPEVTAAIPTPKPVDMDAAEKPAADEPAAVKQASAAQAAAPEGRKTQILRDVTMRAAGKKGAKPIGTIPAKATVDLLQCSQWCQVIYKGKRGWVYKSFVKR